jgi:hypothetical protein
VVVAEEVMEAEPLGEVLLGDLLRQRHRSGQQLVVADMGGAAGEWKDTDERLVLDGLLWVRVREAERGARGGVEDEVAQVRGGGIE